MRPEIYKPISKVGSFIEYLGRVVAIRSEYDVDARFLRFFRQFFIIIPAARCACISISIGPIIRRLSFLLAMFGSTAAWSTTYFYSGPLYTGVGGTFSADMRITGSFTTSNPLAPNLSSVRIGKSGLKLVTSWSFNDGLETYTNSNSSNQIGGGGQDFLISTDMAGNITAFSIGLQKFSGVYPWIWVNAFNISTSPVLYNATNQAPCTATLSPGYSCVAYGGLGVNFAIASTSGSFSTVPIPSTVPALSLTGALLLFGLIAASSVLFLRSKRGRNY